MFLSSYFHWTLQVIRECTEIVFTTSLLSDIIYHDLSGKGEKRTQRMWMHLSYLKTRKKKKRGKERRKRWGSEVAKKKEDRKEGGREEIREEWRKEKRE